MSVSRLVWLGPLVLIAAGCGTAGPVTHPVKGQVQLAGGDAALLAGHSLEIALESDPTVRAYGEIQDDGTFSLETLHAGEIKRGAFEGKYVARVVLEDDDPDRARQITAAIDPRVLDFKTSGLSLHVPAADIVTLPIKRR